MDTTLVRPVDAGFAVRSAPPTAAPTIDVVLPVYNEEAVLERNVLRLYRHLATRLPYTFRITIADNASTDETLAIARRLAARLPYLRATHLDEKGRGRALRTTWLDSDADILVYMDIDLSTDLAALLPLVEPLVSGEADVAIGTRLAPESDVVRGPKREVVSRGYNLITRVGLSAGFSDAQCGFKAIRAGCARELLPLVRDNGWFFDTELLVLAERSGLVINEVPVRWVDDPDSRVAIVPTALADLKGIARLRRDLRARRLPLRAAAEGGRAAGPPPALLRQLVVFGTIGVVSTAAYALLYLLLREALSAQTANALSLLITAIANTAANRRLTFGVRGSRGTLRHQTQGLIVFALGLAVTSGSLVVLRHADPAASHAVELATLIAASVLATLLRFGLFKVWVFPRRSLESVRRAAPAHQEKAA